MQPEAPRVPVAEAPLPAQWVPARLGKLLQFLITGLPAFVLALVLNHALVERLHLHSAASYAIVLFVQVVLNFLLLRRFVFPKSDASQTSVLQDFTALLAGVSVVRLLDWCLYTFLVSVVGLPFLAVQLGNVVLFSLVRFVHAERVLR